VADTFKIIQMQMQVKVFMRVKDYFPLGIDIGRKLIRKNFLTK